MANNINIYSPNRYSSVSGMESGLKTNIYQQIIVDIKSRILKLEMYNKSAAKELRTKYEDLIRKYSAQKSSIMYELYDLNKELEEYESASMTYYLKYKISIFINDVKEKPEDFTIEELKERLDEINGEIDSLKSELIDYADIAEISDLKVELQAIILAIYTRRNNVDTLIDSGLINKDDEILLESFCRELNNKLNSQQESNSEINSLMLFTPKWIYSTKIWNWVGGIYKIPIEVDSKYSDSKDNSEEYGLILPEEKQNVVINIINYFKELFRGKSITQKSGTIRFLKKLNIDTLSNNIPKHERIKLEKTRMMKVGRSQDFLDEELYIPDGREYIMSFLQEIEENQSVLDITYTDKNGLLKSFKEARDSKCYDYTGGSKSLQIWNLMCDLENPVFMFINKIDTLFGTNYLDDCIKELLEGHYSPNKGRSKIYNAAKQSYKKLVEYDNSLESIDDAMFFSERRSKHYDEMGEIVANNTPEIGTAKFLAELNSVERFASMVPKMKRIEFEKRRLKEEIKQEELSGGIYIPDGIELVIAIKNCINNSENDIKFLTKDGKTSAKLVCERKDCYELQVGENKEAFICTWLSIDTIKYCIEIDKIFGSNYTEKVVDEGLNFEIDEGVELPDFSKALISVYRSLKQYFESEQFIKDEEFYQNKRKDYYNMLEKGDSRSQEELNRPDQKEKFKRNIEINYDIKTEINSESDTVGESIEWIDSEKDD